MRRLFIASVSVLAATVLAVTGAVSGAAAATPVSTSPLSCNKLATAASPARAFSVPVSTSNPAINELGVSNGRMPTTPVILAAGGLVCEWSNGLGYGTFSAPTGYVGVTVEFLHGAAAGYDRWATFSPAATGPEFWGCLAGGSCVLYSSVGGDWLTVSFVGARSEAAAYTVAQRISTAIQRAGERSWTPPASEFPLGAKCEQIVPMAALRAALGTSVVLDYRPSLPGWSLYQEAANRIPAPLCIAVNSTGSYSGTQIRTIPGGEWAFNQLRASLTVPGRLTEFRDFPLPDGDRAYIRCNAARTHCILDAILAGHWIQVQILPDERTPVVSVPRPRALADILRAAIVEVYS